MTIHRASACDDRGGCRRFVEERPILAGYLAVAAAFWGIVGVLVLVGTV